MAQQTFNPLENEIQHQLRNRLNHAENSQDVQHAFQHAVRDLLLGIFNEKIRFIENDIEFAPQHAPFYRFAPVISADELFTCTWSNSDLPHILHRFAEQAAHRHRQISGKEKQIEKPRQSTH